MTSLSAQEELVAPNTTSSNTTPQPPSPPPSPPVTASATSPANGESDAPTTSTTPTPQQQRVTEDVTATADVVVGGNNNIKDNSEVMEVAAVKEDDDDDDQPQIPTQQSSGDYQPQSFGQVSMYNNNDIESANRSSSTYYNNNVAQQRQQPVSPSSTLVDDQQQLATPTAKRDEEVTDQESEGVAPKEGGEIMTNNNASTASPQEEVAAEKVQCPVTSSQPGGFIPFTSLTTSPTTTPPSMHHRVPSGAAAIAPLDDPHRATVVFDENVKPADHNPLAVSDERSPQRLPSGSAASSLYFESDGANVDDASVGVQGSFLSTPRAITTASRHLSNSSMASGRRRSGQPLSIDAADFTPSGASSSLVPAAKVVVGVVKKSVALKPIGAEEDEDTYRVSSAPTLRAPPSINSTLSHTSRPFQPSAAPFKPSAAPFQPSPPPSVSAPKYVPSPASPPYISNSVRAKVTSSPPPPPPPPPRRVVPVVQEDYTLIHEFRSLHPSQRNLIDCDWLNLDVFSRGHVVAFATDPEGAKILTQIITSGLEVGSSKTIGQLAMVLDQLLPRILDFSEDPVATPVIQLFTRSRNHLLISPLAQSLRGYCFRMAMSSVSSKILQSLLESCPSLTSSEQEDDFETLPKQEAMKHIVSLVSELRQDELVYRCVLDQSGNHILQRCLMYLPDHSGFIANRLRDRFMELAQHVYGSRVIQCVFEEVKVPRVSFETEQCCLRLMLLTFRGIRLLINTQFGNFVVGHALVNAPVPDDQSIGRGLGDPELRDGTVDRLAVRECLVSATLLRVSLYSRSKFSSNVVQRAVEAATLKARMILAESLLKPTSMLIANLIGYDPENPSLPPPPPPQQHPQHPHQQRKGRKQNQNQQPPILDLAGLSPQAIAQIPEIGALMVDPFGNYVAQTLITNLPEGYRTRLFSAIQPFLAVIVRSHCGKQLLTKVAPDLIPPSWPAAPPPFGDANGNQLSAQRQSGIRVGGEPTSFDGSVGGGGHYTNNNNYDSRDSNSGPGSRDMYGQQQQGANQQEPVLPSQRLSEKYVLPSEFADFNSFIASNRKQKPTPDINVAQLPLPPKDAASSLTDNNNDDDLPLHHPTSNFLNLSPRSQMDEVEKKRAQQYEALIIQQREKQEKKQRDAEARAAAAASYINNRASHHNDAPSALPNYSSSTQQQQKQQHQTRTSATNNNNNNNNTPDSNYTKTIAELQQRLMMQQLLISEQQAALNWNTAPNPNNMMGMMNMMGGNNNNINTSQINPNPQQMMGMMGGGFNPNFMGGGVGGFGMMGGMGGGVGGMMGNNNMMNNPLNLAGGGGGMNMMMGGGNAGLVGGGAGATTINNNNGTTASTISDGSSNAKMNATTTSDSNSVTATNNNQTNNTHNGNNNAGGGWGAGSGGAGMFPQQQQQSMFGFGGLGGMGMSGFGGGGMMGGFSGGVGGLGSPAPAFGGQMMMPNLNSANMNPMSSLPVGGGVGIGNNNNNIAAQQMQQFAASSSGGVNPLVGMDRFGNFLPATTTTASTTSPQPQQQQETLTPFSAFKPPGQKQQQHQPQQPSPQQSVHSGNPDSMSCNNPSSMPIQPQQQQQQYHHSSNPASVSPSPQQQQQQLLPSAAIQVVGGGWMSSSSSSPNQGGAGGGGGGNTTTSNTTTGTSNNHNTSNTLLFPAAYGSSSVGNYHPGTSTITSNGTATPTGFMDQNNNTLQHQQQHEQAAMQFSSLPVANQSSSVLSNHQDVIKALQRTEKDDDDDDGDNDEW